MNIVIFGPQGSGKGTQAELVARNYGLAYISTGDIFRYNLKNDTDLGDEVKVYLDSGNLVPDELTNKMVQDRIQQPDCSKGFVLDGYPRNKMQFDFLSEIAKIDKAFVIELSDEEAMNRLSGRLACQCGLSYHTEFNPPKIEGVCNGCSKQLFRRDDDKPEAIKKRLDIYHQETEPLIDQYESENILQRVDGSGLIKEVYKQIEDILKS